MVWQGIDIMGFKVPVMVILKATTSQDEDTSMVENEESLDL